MSPSKQAEILKLFISELPNDTLGVYGYECQNICFSRKAEKWHRSPQRDSSICSSEERPCLATL